MIKKRNSISDLRGTGRLAIDAVNGVIDIVEAIHYNITSLGGLLRKSKQQRTSGITGMVYSNIRSITGLAGRSIEILLEKLALMVNEKEPTAEQEAILAALNGVIGDHLEKTNNPLAITMQLRRNGKPFPDEEVETIELDGQKIVLLIHGSCMNDLQWNLKGHDHGAALAADLGFKPIYLHYNSGRHISENGKSLTNLLESFFDKIHADSRFVILAHSMGGLVARSACHYGKALNHQWINRLDKMVFLGTPHHGAPLEQTGNWIDNMLLSNKFSAPIAQLGKLRSAGITDLRYGNILDEDWNSRDRFEPAGDQRTPVPLPAGIPCFAIAATIGVVPSVIGDDIVGDGLVPLFSALGRHTHLEFQLAFAENNQWVGRKMKHLELLNHPEVYGKIKEWLGDRETCKDLP